MINWNLINNLEDSKRYKEAFKILKKEWLVAPQDLQLTVRLGFLCWYTVVEWGVFEHDFEESEYSLLEETLKEITKVGINSLDDETEFLWIFGYMITLFPFYFGEYEEWEKRGNVMLEKANYLRPDDPIIEMVYLAGVPTSKYKEACVRAKPIVKEKFKGQGKLNEYFRDVLDR